MISLKNIQASILGETLFEKLSLSVLSKDRIGIVGPNGSGKTTLMRIILGEVAPDAGNVSVTGERLGYLPQEVIFGDEETIVSFLGTNASSPRAGLLKTVGLEKIDIHSRIKDLSGGQKRRVALAKVLSRQPTFLLLDEPTNHLDVETIRWLESFILEFKGGILVISHDRKLLDATATKILEIDPVNHSVTEFTGNYSAYKAEKVKRMAIQEDAYKRQQREIKQLEEWLARKREEAKIYDDPSKGRQIRAKEKYLERELYDKEIARPGSEKTMHDLDLLGEVANAKLICRCKGIKKSFGSQIIFKGVSFEIRGRERILLQGNNGSGKTTLLRILLGQISPDEGEVKIGENVAIGYFAQEHEGLDREKTVIDEFKDSAGLKNDQDARSVLGSFLFSGQDVFKKISSLSLGERARLSFAKLTFGHYGLLVLDEPTNHLDIASKEVIEEALIGFKGAILAISHDRYFTERVGFHRVLTIAKGSLRESIL